MEYYTCLKCETIGLPCIILFLMLIFSSKICARLKIRSNQIFDGNFKHDPRCIGTYYSNIKAAEIDRNQRRELATNPGRNPKIMWSEVKNFAIKNFCKPVKFEHCKHSKIALPLCRFKSKNKNFKGLNKALKEDASFDKGIEGRDSYSRNFPDWKTARSSYQKRSQKANINFTNPYELPRSLQVTRLGALRLEMGKETDNSHR